MISVQYDCFPWDGGMYLSRALAPARRTMQCIMLSAAYDFRGQDGRECYKIYMADEIMNRKHCSRNRTVSSQICLTRQQKEREADSSVAACPPMGLCCGCIASAKWLAVPHLNTRLCLIFNNLLKSKTSWQDIFGSKLNIFSGPLSRD